jgi:hypothetical protein
MPIRPLIPANFQAIVLTIKACIGFEKSFYLEFG